MACQLVRPQLTLFSLHDLLSSNLQCTVPIKKCNFLQSDEQRWTGVACLHIHIFFQMTSGFTVYSSGIFFLVDGIGLPPVVSGLGQKPAADSYKQWNCIN